ncbi:hypothetical protein ACFOPX_04745 [Helicobacter baculiformis]|uniref:Uncharacterized protein n=1 Tax=Helicobacter baculiformis TaxID=427351 RepID=A0ABV7ZI62_9HELI|nr:hypothetical protein [Helicobacter baculiformis]
MRMMIRHDITILENNLVDNTPEFDPSCKYKVGDRVRLGDQKMIYACLKDTPQGVKADLANDFKQVGADNTIAAFDTGLNTYSSTQEPLELKIQTSGALFMANCLFGALCVRVYAPNIEEPVSVDTLAGPYEGTYLLGHAGECVYHIAMQLFKDLPIRVGVIFCGDFVEVGITLYRDSLSLEDFSKINVNDEGLTQIELGLFRKTYKFSVLVGLQDLDRTLGVLAKNKSIPSVIELSDALACLRFFGLIRGVDVSFNDAQRVNLDLELEELT